MRRGQWRVTLPVLGLGFKRGAWRPGCSPCSLCPRWLIPGSSKGGRRTTVTPRPAPESPWVLVFSVSPTLCANPSSSWPASAPKRKAGELLRLEPARCLMKGRSEEVGQQALSSGRRPSKVTFTHRSPPLVREFVRRSVLLRPLAWIACRVRRHDSSPTPGRVAPPATG